jgi:hypothetical protein
MDFVSASEDVRLVGKKFSVLTPWQAKTVILVVNRVPSA